MLNTWRELGVFRGWDGGCRPLWLVITDRPLAGTPFSDYALLTDASLEIMQIW